MDTSKNTLSQQELDEVLNQHRLWLETHGKEGQQADLSGQRLIGLNLSRTNLRRAKFFEANLHKACLIGTDLRKTNLFDANLIDANLNEAYLREACLIGADLRRADLIGTDLVSADCREANLSKAKLMGADLREANLGNAKLIGTNLMGANFTGAIFDNTDIETTQNWQYAIGINTTSATSNLFQKLQHKSQELIQLKIELAAAKRSEQTDGQNIEKISYLENQVVQAEKEKEDIENRLSKLEKELEQKNEILSNQIDEAQKALAETFKDSADQQIKKHGRAAAFFGYAGGLLILADGFLIAYFLYKYWFKDDIGKPLDWSFAVYSFPVLIILVLATTLLRHQKKLLDEVRHFAAVKQQIELYSGLLKASQHAAAHLNDPDKSAEYVQETFSQIRTKLLQHNFTAAPTDNKDNDTSSGVDKLTEKLLEKMADAISKSGKSTS